MKPKNMREHMLMDKAHNKGYEKGKEEGANKGINLILPIIYSQLNEIYGFGDKRLDRLEDGIFKEMKRLEGEG